MWTSTRTIVAKCKKSITQFIIKSRSRVKVPMTSKMFYCVDWNNTFIQELLRKRFALKQKRIFWISFSNLILLGILSLGKRPFLLALRRWRRFATRPHCCYHGCQRLFLRGFRFLSSLYSCSRGFGLRPKMCRPSANNENSHRTREKPLVPRIHCCILMWHIVLACSSLRIGSRVFLELDTYLYLYLKSCVPWFTSKFLCFRVVPERRLTRGVPKWQPIWTRFKIMVIIIVKRAWREWRKEFHKKWSPGDLLAYMLFEIKKNVPLNF